MPKGYWIAHGLVHDTKAYDRYRAANAEAFAKFGARFLVRGGDQQAPEGQSKPRTVVIEFDSYDQALACYDSPEYAAARVLRDDPAIAVTDLVIVAGYDGPQP